MYQMLKCLLYKHKDWHQVPSTLLNRLTWQYAPMVLAMGSQRLGDLNISLANQSVSSSVRDTVSKNNVRSDWRRQLILASDLHTFTEKEREMQAHTCTYKHDINIDIYYTKWLLKNKIQQVFMRVERKNKSLYTVGGTVTLCGPYMKECVFSSK